MTETNGAVAVASGAELLARPTSTYEFLFIIIPHISFCVALETLNLLIQSTIHKTEGSRVLYTKYS